jgi:glutamate-1-semialdehyde 2,1-aminomutase
MSEARTMTPIEQQYRRRTQASRTAMQRAAAVMPGGNTRTTTFHAPYPVVFRRGEGPWLFDADGHRYVDLFYNGLSLIHGHGYGPVAEAMAPILRSGTAWSGASEAQIEFAELLTRRVPGAGQLRFTNSGSEAAMLAVKLARRATARDTILKFRYAYHGSFPDLEAGLYGNGELGDRVALAEFNDMGSVERAFERHGERIAAVIYEPVMFTGRVVPAQPGFLQGVETIARRHGALPVLDDCLMFRLAVGGSQERFGLRPDIVVLGKFIGGGTPVGAVIARRELMEVFDPTKRGAAFHGGSFNGNVLGCVAGRVAMNELTAQRIAAMDVRTDALVGALQSAATSAGVRIHVSGAGSVGGIAFEADPSRHEDDPSALTYSALYHLACLNHGVAMGPGGLFALATQLDDAALDHTISGMSAAFRDLAGITT